MLLHGFSLAPLARGLGLHLGEGDGVLIVGASPWATDFAAALHALGVDVTLSDTYPGALRPARRRGVPVLQAEVLSRHGEEAIEERPIDYVIAATPDEVYNGLVCARLAPELGRERVFQMAPSESGTDPHTGMTRDLRGKVFASADLDYATMETLYRNGARFEVAELAETAPNRPEHNGYPLVLARKGGGLFIPSPENPALISARPGDRTLYLVLAEPQARSGPRHTGETTISQA
jgi:hypothetical protein